VRFLPEKGAPEKGEESEDCKCEDEICVTIRLRNSEVETRRIAHSFARTAL
jgi:hypothetical protein